ncbi:NAD-dependent epimerase/dehydratase family protein [Pseudomonas sp. HR1]|uniref:NAD-dependent epimerase/dehydratase family protein n=1 Tax=Pseudomonas sp. HR1 TaxID=1463361 RepID=UPI002542764A|nr:NAD-dependent epimerase/dehydratase family protein [Pseudomonas sp. HR1]MDK4198606.1 NAD-dependent epimerase/dehydratase family protein [Pseudomonas sp. HR1]
MPTALVTGASGFTGRYLIHALKARDFKIIGLGSGSTDADVTVACDLTDKAAVAAAVAQAQPDWVIHLAALAFVGHADQEAFYRVNLFGTLNLLEALGSLERQPQRVLIASSANIYGTPGIEVIDESVCPAPVNHYACSKLAMEHMVATWYDRLPIVITRPFNYTGPGQDERFLIPKIVGHFARGERAIELGNLDVSRDFSDVRDLVQAYIGLLDSTHRSSPVNVCSGQATALRTVIQMAEQIAGYAIEVRVNPAFVRANEIPVLRGDDARLRGIVGPRDLIPLQQTLSDLFRAIGSGARRS